MSSTNTSTTKNQLLNHFPKENHEEIQTLLEELKKSNPSDYEKILDFTEKCSRFQTIIDFIRKNPKKWFFSPLEKLEISTQPILLLDVGHKNKSLHDKIHLISKLTAPYLYPDELIRHVKDHFAEWFRLSEKQMMKAASVVSSVLKVVNSSNTKFSLVKNELTTQAILGNEQLSNWIAEYKTYWADFSEQKMQICLDAFQHPNPTLFKWIEQFPAVWKDLTSEKAKITVKAFKNKELSNKIQSNSPGWWALLNCVEMLDEINNFKGEKSLTNRCQTQNNQVKEASKETDLPPKKVNFFRFCFPCLSTKSVMESVLESSAKGKKSIIGSSSICKIR